MPVWLPVPKNLPRMMKQTVRRRGARDTWIAWQGVKGFSVHNLNLGWWEERTKSKVCYGKVLEVLRQTLGSTEIPVLFFRAETAVTAGDPFPEDLALRTEIRVPQSLLVRVAYVAPGGYVPIPKVGLLPGDRKSIEKRLQSK